MMQYIRSLTFKEACLYAVAKGVVGEKEAGNNQVHLRLGNGETLIFQSEYDPGYFEEFPGCIEPPTASLWKDRP